MQLSPLDLHTSRRLAGFFLVIHGGAMLCVLNVNIMAAIKIPLLLLILYSLGYCLSRYVLFWLPNSVIKLRLSQQGTWILHTKNGKVLIAQLRGDSVLTSVFVLLNFQQPQKRFYFFKHCMAVLICTDSIEEQSLRQLRVYLRTLKI